MVRLGEEISQALKACNGEALKVEVAGSNRRFVLVDESEYEAAIAALEFQKNVVLIREGVASMEAGRTRPLEEAMDDIRRKLMERKGSEALR